MNGKASLRSFAVIQLVYGVWLVAVAVYRERIFAALEAPNNDFGTISKQLDLLSHLWTYGSSTFLVASLAALGAFLAATWKRPGRTATLASIVCLVIYGIFYAWEVTHPVEAEPTTALRVQWMVTSLLLDIGVALPLLAATRVGARRGSTTIVLAAATIALDFAVSAYAILASHPLHGISKVATAASVLLQLVVGVGAWWSAKGVETTREESSPTSSAEATRETYDGTALRLLGWAFVVRVAVGGLAQAGTVAAMASKDFEGAGTAMVLGVVGSIGAGILVVIGLIRYLSLPTRLRSSEAIGFALVASGVGAALDVWAASTGVQLFDLVSQATKATSFWGMPSLTKIEEMQSTLALAGGAGVLLGVAAAYALVTSLKQTASAIGARSLAEHAGGVLVLIVAVGVSCVAVGIAVAEKSDPALFLVGPIVLLLALALLVRSLQLYFRLADALEGKRDAADTDTAVPAA